MGSRGVDDLSFKGSFTNITEVVGRGGDARRCEVYLLPFIPF